jgi:vesicle transport protein SEC22
MSSELNTYIARPVDGLILCETWSSDETGKLKQEAKKILVTLRNAPIKCTVDASQASYHYLIENGVAFLTCSSKGFSKQRAFGFLEDISKLFQEEMKRVIGSTGSVDYRSYVETINKPYHFIAFDRIIQKRRAEWLSAQGPSNQGVLKVQEGLLEVNQIMRKSLDEMLQRGEALEDVGRRADDLKSASKAFAKRANLMNLQALLRDWGIVAAIALLFLFVIWWRFF